MRTTRVLSLHMLFGGGRGRRIRKKRKKDGRRIPRERESESRLSHVKKGKRQIHSSFASWHNRCQRYYMYCMGRLFLSVQSLDTIMCYNMEGPIWSKIIVVVVVAAFAYHCTLFHFPNKISRRRKNAKITNHCFTFHRVVEITTYLV